MAKKKGTSTPEKFLATVRNNTIYTKILQGKTIQQIADELGTQEENIRTDMTKVMHQMTVDTLEKKEKFLALTTSRTEYLLSKILVAVEKQTAGDGELIGPSRDLLQGALQIMKFQKELLIPNEKNGEVNIQVNQTFNADSPLYDGALQNMQVEKFGTTVHKIESEEPMMITLSPELARLEDLATKYEVKDDDTTPPETT